MSTSLVYLHIPKSAGTSHRAYLMKVFGEDEVFWYGLHTESDKFDAGEVGPRPAIGGHRPLDFYPASLDALYTSVVRDPVERAVSFFNYCIAPPDKASIEWSEQRAAAQRKWRDWGIDPTSMVNSINNCEQFRSEISNLQCSYLSRYEPTFEGVQRTLQEHNFVIGLFDQLSLFNEFLQNELGFPIENKVRANVGQAGYSSDILKEPGLAALIRSINLEDQLLHDFIRLEQDGLFVGAGNIEAVRARVPSFESRSSQGEARDDFNWNKVHLYSKGLVKLPQGDKALVPVMVRNQTNSHVIFTKEDGDPLEFGWELQTTPGESLNSLRGTVRVNQSVPAKESKMVLLVLDILDQIPDDNTARYIEFSIVENGVWVRDSYPLSPAWSKLYV
ncbi:MAG: sulfotransferase family 2 domain-containing protein [Thiohalobacterales bacterium]|nr:sulfotransferase family 2 domain-containing protein [Thiohalobacterales bacterium]